MMDLKSIWDRVATKGDVATVLLCGTAGFTVDLLAMPFGVPPGTVATLSAAGGLGVKNAIQAAADTRRLARESEEEKRKKGEAELQSGHLNRKLRERADRFSQLLDENGIHIERDALKAEIILFDDEMISAEDLQAAIDQGKMALRAHIRDKGLRPARRGEKRPKKPSAARARALNIDSPSGEDEEQNWLVPDG